MKPVDVLYFIEHVAREFDIACAVKHLVQQEHQRSVEIAGIAAGRSAALATFQPKVVAIPYCMSVSDLGLEEIVRAWPHAKYINLSFEQVLGRTQRDFKTPRDTFAREVVLHHAWGEFFAEFLETSAVPRRQIVVNGNPAYTLLQPPYRNYYGNPRDELARRYGLDPAKRWVFVPENYGWAFFSDRMVRSRIQRGFNPRHAYQYRDFARASLRAVAQWWRDAASLDAIEIIVRPRPAIQRELFIETITAMAGALPKRLHIIKDGTVREWLFASDVVFSSFSTTLLEAAVVQKPLYMMTPQPFPDFIYSEWYDLAENVESADAFMDVITRPELDANWQSLHAWVQNEMMSNGDALANLAGILAAMVAGELEVPQPIAIAHQLEQFTWKKVERRIRKMGWDLLQSGLRSAGVKTVDQNWTTHESDTIPPDAIAQCSARWAAVLGKT